MIGVDLVYIPEFKKQMELGKQAFINRAFVDGELKNLKPEHLAGLWAAKEAVFKASDNAKFIALNKISITQDSSDKLSSKFYGKTFEISISHQKDYVVAVAIALKVEK